MMDYADEFEEYRVRASSGGVLPLSYDRARRTALDKRAAMVACKRAAARHNTHRSSDEDSPAQPRCTCVCHDVSDSLRQRVSSMPLALAGAAAHSSVGELHSQLHGHLRSRDWLASGCHDCVHHIRSYSITPRGGLQKNQDLLITHSLSDEPVSQTLTHDLTARGRASEHVSTCSLHLPRATLHLVALLGRKAVGKSCMLQKFARANSDIFISCSVGEYIALIVCCFASFSYQRLL